MVSNVKMWVGIIIVGIIITCVLLGLAFLGNIDNFSNDDSMIQKGGGLSYLEKIIIGIIISIGIAGICVVVIAIYKHRRNLKIYPQQ